MNIPEYQHALATFETATRNLLQDYHIPNAIPQLYRGYIVEVFGFDPAEPKRSNDRMSEAKHCYRALLRFNLNLSTQEIADLSGGINHTSVCYSVKAHRKLFMTDKSYFDKVVQVEEKIDNFNKN